MIRYIAVYDYLTNNANLVTTAKAIVGAINENAEKISGMSGVVSVKVVATLPASPTEKTIYYVGSSAPYTIKLYVDGAYTDLGTTSVDMSQYVQKTDVVDNLTSTSTNAPLSANQGKVLNEGKVNVSDVVNDLTHTDTDKPLSANQGKVLNEGKVSSSNLYKIGDVYETLSDTETTATLATRFGGTWTTLPDRIEDTWKSYGCTWNVAGGMVTNFTLLAKISEDKAYVDVQMRGSLSANSVPTTGEYEIVNNMKVTGTFFNSAYIDNFPLYYFDSNNAIQTATLYISGANKMWLGTNKGGNFSGLFVGRKVVAWTNVFTPDRIFKRFKRTA